MPSKKLKHVIAIFRNGRELWKFQRSLEKMGYQNEFASFEGEAIALMLDLLGKRIVPVREGVRRLLGLDGRIVPLYGLEVLEHKKELLQERNREAYLKLLRTARSSGFRSQGIRLIRKKKEQEA